MLALDRNFSKGAVLHSAFEDAETLSVVFRGRPVEKAMAGTPIVHHGDLAKDAFLIECGNVRVTRLLPDGRRVITGFLEAGDIFGLSYRDRYMYGVEAIDEVTYRRMSRRDFEGDALSPRLRTELLSRLHDEMSAAQDQLVLLACKSADERICSFLLQRLERANVKELEDPTIVLPMTRQDVADYLGMTIETVSRTITRLAGKGVVATKGRHGIQVTNLGALLRRAGDGEEWPRETPTSGWRARQQRAGGVSCSPAQKLISITSSEYSTTRT